MPSSTSEAKWPTAFALALALVALIPTASSSPAPGTVVPRTDGEHVVLADCRDSNGVLSSQMAYFPSAPSSKPQDVSIINTPAGQTALWVGGTTSGLFTTTGVTFTAKLGSKVADGAFAGTGNNGYGDFTCWQRYALNLYTYGNTTCSQVYDCDHETAPATSSAPSSTPSPTPTSVPTVSPTSSPISPPTVSSASSPNNNTVTTSSRSSSLSTGAIAAIIVVVVVLAIGVIAGFIWMRKQKWGQSGKEVAELQGGNRAAELQGGKQTAELQGNWQRGQGLYDDPTKKPATHVHELDGQWRGVEANGQ